MLKVLIGKNVYLAKENKAGKIIDGDMKQMKIPAAIFFTSHVFQDFAFAKN
jgi:hypothetical protein